MFRQPHDYGSGPPPLSAPNDEGGGRGGDLDNRNIHRSIPINNDPGAVIETTEAIEADDAPSIPPSFALLSALRQRNLRSWPRQRRRDSKSPRPAPQPQSQSQPLASTSSSSLHRPTLITPNPVAVPPFHSPLSSLLALPPAGSAFMQHRSRETEQPKQHRQRRQMPSPLNANPEGRSPSHSPPLLPSPPPSAPSVAETPRDVEQLAGEFSRQHLERTTTTCFRSASGSISTSASGSDSGPGSRNGNRNRYGDAFASFSPAMAEFRLRRGGNEPVMDLEVDMDQDSRNDDGDCLIRPPSPSPFASASKFEPSSSYAASADIDAGSIVPLGLQRMRLRQVALADASVRHLDLGLKPFARQISPETDAAQEPQQANVAPGTAAPPKETATPNTTPVSTAATTTRALIPTSTGAAAVAEASPIEVGDDDLPPLPLESMALVAPYPQRSFHLHSHSYSRSYHSQSLSYSRSLPHSRPHSRQPSTSTRGGAPPSHCLPLSSEVLAMPHLAPLHNDVPSSGYDMQGWLSSSSTVEATAALTTGTVDACSGTYSTGCVPENGSSVVSGSHAMDTLVEGVVSNNDDRNDWPPPTAAPPVRTTPRASDRRQQSKQFYTAYLQPHHLPFFQSSGPNPPVGVLEADMEEPNTGSIDDRIATNQEETGAAPAPASASTSASASGSATASHTRNQGSAKTTTQSGQYMVPSQRVRLIQMAMTREVERIRSGQSAGGSSTDGSGAIVPDDRMDVEMMDPTAIESYAPSPGPASSSMDSSLLGPLPPIWDPDQPNPIHKYMGPFRYRLSSEVAMRCTNLVHSKPRMRRRRQPGEGSETTNDGGNSLRSGSIKDASSLHSERRSERRRERHRERVREREGQAVRDPERGPHPHQPRDGREERNRTSRHREHVRLATAHFEVQAQSQSQSQLFPLAQPSPPPDPLLPPVPDPALMYIEQHQQHHQPTQQHPLPVWRPPVDEPPDAATIDMS